MSWLALYQRAVRGGLYFKTIVKPLASSECSAPGRPPHRWDDNGSISHDYIDPEKGGPVRRPIISPLRGGNQREFASVPARIVLINEAIRDESSARAACSFVLVGVRLGSCWAIGWHLAITRPAGLYIVAGSAHATPPHTYTTQMSEQTEQSGQTEQNATRGGSAEQE